MNPPTFSSLSTRSCLSVRSPAGDCRGAEGYVPRAGLKQNPGVAGVLRSAQARVATLYSSSCTKSAAIL
jgi:hypothetical protein